MTKILSSLVVVLASSAAQAGWLVEPYLGYESGKLAQTDTADIDLSGKTMMMDLGLRLGYRLSGGFWMAADYMYGFNGTFTYDNPSNGTNSKSNKSDLGVTLGWDIQLKYRIVLGYIIEPIYRTVDDAPGGQENSYLNGSSFKAGFGYIFTSWFAWTLEYYSNSPTKYRNNTGTYSISDTNHTFADSGFRLLVSAPLNFGGGK